MYFTDLFIKRPVLATVVSLLIVLIGVQSGLKLPIRQFPELSNTTITVMTAYPGANADLIQGFITVPIQQAVASTEGLDTLVATSTQNVSTVTLNLKLDADPDRAMTDVLSKIAQVKRILPREADDSVVTKKTGEGYALMYLSFNSKVMNSSQITDYLNRVVQPRLQTIDGVASAEILGGQVFAMRVWLDPDRMASLGVTPLDVRAALAKNNFTSAAGQIKGDFVQTNIDAKTSLDDPAAFGRLTVLSRGDSLVRLEDVAEIELGPQSADSSSVFNGLKAVFIGVYATPTANPLTVIGDVREAFPDIQKELPPGIEAAIAYDATKFIRASIWEVVKTLGEAAIIVVLVIFLFLGNLRSTIIPIVTIPLSLIGVLGILYALGYSINLMTLLALVLAIGLVVDDAIVVVENIYRHIEDGKRPYEAALIGAREILYPVIAMTITLAAVFAPIGFVSGLTGTLFKEFAFTLAGAVIVSGVVALTLSPMMCSRLLKAQNASGGGEGRFTRFLDRMFDGLKRRYQRRLHGTLNYRPVTMLVLAGVIVATGIMYMTAPKELAPEEDQGILFTLVKTPQYANLDYLEDATQQLYRVYSTVPEKEHVFTINGMGDVHKGFVGILLKPWGERERNQKEVLQDLSPRINSLPTAFALSFSPPALPGSTGGPPVQFVITTTHDFRQLADVLADVEKSAKESGLFIFSDSDLRFETPQIEFNIDHDKANRLGISMADIGNSLATLLGGNYVNLFDLYGRSYQVIPQVPREYRRDADWLTRYQIRTSSGALVPLSNVASITRSVQPNSLTNFQQLNSATLSAVPFPGRTVSEAIDFLKVQAAGFPEGFSFDFQGESRQFVQEGNTLVYTFIFALVIIFLVLAAQYESFRDPIIILIALPTAIFGALLPLTAGLGTVNIYTQIGLVTLIGLISKHGILMVDFANKLQEGQGYTRRAAIEEAAALRLRPILMTTTATVVAMIPLLIAAGAGAASRFAIGVVIAAGMTIGTLFTLFVTPAVYTYVSRDRHKAKGDAAAAEAAPLTSPAEPELAAAAPAETGAPSVPAVAVPAVASEGRLSSEARAFSSAAAATTSGRKRKQKAAKRQSARPRRFSPAAE
jgi:multidrug efflux pump